MDFGLYWEHCWPANGPNVTNEQRLAWLRRLVDEIEDFFRRRWNAPGRVRGALTP